MLNDQEFTAVWQLWEKERAREPFLRSQGSRDSLAAGLSVRELLFRPLQEAYEKVTGLKFDGDDPKAIMHYRASFYGPPCPHCGRLLRNVRAKQCFECGMDWHDPQNIVCRKARADGRGT